MSTIAQLRERREAQERQLFSLCVRLETWSLADLWRQNRHFNYQWMSATFRQWWRDGLVQRWDDYDETWLDGFPWTAIHHRSKSKAIYRWKEL